MTGTDETIVGRVWPTLLEVTGRALACGALQPIHTEQSVVEEAGVGFLVRSVSSLRRKEEDRRRPCPPAGFNPFLPPEPELTLGPLSDTHVAILNKFQVIDHHLLIVTRAFEEQERLLVRADWEALAAVLGEIDGLAFYNGGRVAGASQRHKHLQLVPLPLVRSGPEMPLSPWFDGALTGDGRVPGLPFVHAFAPLPEGVDAQGLQALYRGLLDRIGAAPQGGGVQARPYNLLVTRSWMLAVPRCAEHFRSISVNALGFAGSLFVKDAAEMALVRTYGPLGVLRRVVQREEAVPPCVGGAERHPV